MPRLIRVFAGRTLTLLVLSCRGSYVYPSEKQKRNFIHKFLYDLILRWTHCHFVGFVMGGSNIEYVMASRDKTEKQTQPIHPVQHTPFVLLSSLFS